MISVLFTKRKLHSVSSSQRLGLDGGSSGMAHASLQQQEFFAHLLVALQSKQACDKGEVRRRVKMWLSDQIRQTHVNSLSYVYCLHTGSKSIFYFKNQIIQVVLKLSEDFTGNATANVFGKTRTLIGFLKKRERTKQFVQKWSKKNEGMSLVRLWEC